MKWGALGSLGAIALLAAQSARAAEGEESSSGLFGALHPELAARIMLGTALTAPGSVPSPWLGGLGVRAGASYRGLYGGLSFMDFTSESSCLNSYPGSCESIGAASYGIELGYGTTLVQWFNVRGVLGLGDYVLTADGTSTTCVDWPSCSATTTARSHASDHNLYLAPGFLLAASLGPVLVGLDVSLHLVPDASAPGLDGRHPPSAFFAAFMVGAQAGVRL